MNKMDIINKPIRYKGQPENESRRGHDHRRIKKRSSTMSAWRSPWFRELHASKIQGMGGSPKARPFRSSRSLISRSGRTEGNGLEGGQLGRPERTPSLAATSVPSWDRLPDVFGSGPPSIVITAVFGAGGPRHMTTIPAQRAPLAPSARKRAHASALAHLTGGEAKEKGFRWHRESLFVLKRGDDASASL